MDMDIAFIFHPPPGTISDIVDILKFSGIQKIVFDILKRRLDLSFGLGACWFTGDRPALIMGDKGHKRRIVYGLAALPSQDDRFFIIIQAGLWQATKVCKGILMSSNQCMEFSVCCKIDVLPSGKAQNVREAKDCGFAGFNKRDRIGAPVHLALSPGNCFKANHRLAFGLWPHHSQVIGDDGLAAVISNAFELFGHPYASDVGELFDERFHLGYKRVQFAAALLLFGQNIMSLIPFCLMVS